MSASFLKLSSFSWKRHAVQPGHFATLAVAIAQKLLCDVAAVTMAHKYHDVGPDKGAPVCFRNFPTKCRLLRSCRSLSVHSRCCFLLDIRWLLLGRLWDALPVWWPWACSEDCTHKVVSLWPCSGGSWPIPSPTGGPVGHPWRQALRWAQGKAKTAANSGMQDAGSSRWQRLVLVGHVSLAYCSAHAPPVSQSSPPYASSLERQQRLSHIFLRTWAQNDDNRVLAASCPMCAHHRPCWWAVEASPTT